MGQMRIHSRTYLCSELVHTLRLYKLKSILITGQAGAVVTSTAGSISTAASKAQKTLICKVSCTLVTSGCPIHSWATKISCLQRCTEQYSKGILSPLASEMHTSLHIGKYEDFHCSFSGALHMDTVLC